MFLQEQIENLRRRLKNIEENPRPYFMRSNKLRYEIELEQYTHVLEAGREGKPFAVLHGVEQLAQPLGFEIQLWSGWGDRVRNPQRYYDIAVNKLGFPGHTCDRTITRLGLFLSGEVPTPRLLASRRIPCDPERWSSMAAAKYAGVLFHELDRRNSYGEENIRYVAEQVAELIKFAERSIAGIRFNEEKLVELLEIDNRAMQYQIDTYQLRARVPCPISPQDSFRLMPVPSRYPRPNKVLEYCRMYHDELFERAEKGVGGVPEEKLRIAWLATGPYGRATFDLLTRKGVSLPWFHYGAAPYWFGVVRNDYGDEHIYGRKLCPLEELARNWNTNVWAGSGDMWVDSLVNICQELKIDAVVDFLQAGCTTTKSLKWITARRLREELGIPTLDLEGRELFASETGRNEMNRKLEDFINMCIANKSST